MQYYWTLLLCAFFLEITFGYPKWLFKRIRHPVVWMGACISFLEQNFNRNETSAQKRTFLGCCAMALLLAATLTICALAGRIGGSLLQVLLMSALLASRSLYDHVYDVLDALTHDGIEAARTKVARIVGRDVTNLDESSVSRAAIESLAESFCDGVIAPIFWAACLGLPGIACYKAINTADSMIGHKDDRYRAYGWAAARLDDVANFIPARISGFLIALAAFSNHSIRIMLKYAYNHASPNAGWPEAAMAGALRIQLGGANSYDGVEHASAIIGEGTTQLDRSYLNKALSIYLNACAIVWFMLLLALIAR